ncbi:hypothetical protein Tco_0725531 [Tanacetum coccineum]|uniref:Uncharacterized protein n=1 Tax=Tanacetum coccineum TaxID=301880 RepID=A0ABQ4YDU6_9ASTR
MDDPDITMEEYVQLETDRALRNGKVYNWEKAMYCKIWYDEDIHYMRFFKTEFPAIVYNDALASESDFSSEPTISPQRVDEISLKNETSLFEYDDTEYNVISYNDIFPFNIFSVDDSKSDMDNVNDNIDIKQYSGDILIEPLPNVISTYISPMHKGQINFWKQVMMKLVNFSLLKLS